MRDVEIIFNCPECGENLVAIIAKDENNDTCYCNCENVWVIVKPICATHISDT